MNAFLTVLLGCEALVPAAQQVALDVAQAQQQAATQQPTIEIYRGTCDASAAVVLPDGRLAIGNDEDNTLRVYEIGDPEVKRSIDLTPVLAVDAKRPEADIEAATRVGNEVFWITSHGRNRSGKYRASRYRFFRTTLPAPGDTSFDIASSTVSSQTFLVDLEHSALGKTYAIEQASQRAPGEKDGFNIEGLSVMPNGSVLVGLRNPVPARKALLVQVDNPEEVVTGKAPARIETQHLLDLGGLGIRSLEYIEALKAYVLVAGCPDDSCDRPSVLYKWDPDHGALDKLDIDVSGLNPEGLVYDDASGELWIISDDGSLRYKGERCKDLPPEQQQFRVMRTVLR